jgi:hypothetical protein
VLVCVVLVVEAAALLVSAFSDVLFGQEVPALARVFPIAICLVTVIALADVVRELKRPRRGIGRRIHKASEMVTVIVAQAAIIPVLLVPLWIELHSGYLDFTDLLIVVPAGIGLVVALGITVSALAARPQVTFSKGWVVFLALLPLFSVVQFWYSSLYKPTHQRPNVNIEASLEKVGPTAEGARVKAIITLQNDGPTDLNLFEAVYTVTGFGTSPAGGALTERQLADALSGTRVAADDPGASYEGLLKVGRLIRPGGHLVQGQKLTTSVVFDVKSGVADKLRLTVRLSTVVDNGQDLPEFKPCDAGLDHPGTCEETEVPTQGWLGAVLSDDPVARVVFNDRPKAPPGLETDFGYARAKESPDDFQKSQQVQDVYPYLNSRGFTTSVEYADAPAPPAPTGN